MTIAMSFATIAAMTEGVCFGEFVIVLSIVTDSGPVVEKAPPEPHSADEDLLQANLALLERPRKVGLDLVQVLLMMPMAEERETRQVQYA